MSSFLAGLLGGAAIGGGYVLLRTPRSGSENQIFVKDFVNTTKTNVADVQDKASNLQAAVKQLNAEVTKLQVGFVPEVMKIADDFQTEASVYTRRINGEIEQISNHAEVMTNRINMQNQKVQIDPTTDDQAE